MYEALWMWDPILMALRVLPGFLPFFLSQCQGETTSIYPRWATLSYPPPLRVPKTAGDTGLRKAAEATLGLGFLHAARLRVPISGNLYVCNRLPTRRQAQMDARRRKRKQKEEEGEEKEKGGEQGQEEKAAAALCGFHESHTVVLGEVHSDLRQLTENYNILERDYTLGHYMKLYFFLTHGNSIYLFLICFSSIW